MPRKTPKIVPWATYDEWNQVFLNLFADPDQLHRRDAGVKTVKAWLSRGKVPHSVASTAGFVEVQLRDALSSSAFHGMPVTPLSEKELRTLYGMAMIRFVNGITDEAQTGQYARSIAALAGEIGLPLWFVDLRHASTHDYLPSLGVLRSGCSQALQWLYENYWILQKTFVEDVGDMVEKLLERYKGLRSQDMKSSTHGDKIEAVVSEITTILSAETYNEILLPLLLRPGNLIVTPSKHTWNSKCKIPSSMVDMWTPLFEKLNIAWPDFMEELCLFMIEKLDESSFLTSSTDTDALSVPATTSVSSKMTMEEFYWCITSWVQYLCSNFSESCGSVASDRKDVIEACLRKPNAYTRTIIRKLDTNGVCDPYIQFSKKAEKVQNEVNDFKRKIDNAGDVIMFDDTYVPVDEEDLQRRMNAIRARVEHLEGIDVDADSINMENNDAMEGGTEDDREEPPIQLFTHDRTYAGKEWTHSPLGCLPKSLAADYGQVSGVGGNSNQRGFFVPDLVLPDEWDDVQWCRNHGAIGLEDAAAFMGPRIETYSPPDRTATEEEKKQRDEVEDVVITNSAPAPMNIDLVRHEIKLL